MKIKKIALLVALFFLTILALTNSNALVVFDKAWGTQGTGNGQFDSPEGVAVDSAGNVFVADTVNCRVQKFDSNGTFLTSFGTQGPTAGTQFNTIKALAFDKANYLYTLEDVNSRVEKFNSGSSYITTWGIAGNLASQFAYPLGISVFSTATSGATVSITSDIFVADTQNFRVQKFRTTSTSCSTTTITTNTGGTWLTVWGQGGTTASTIAGQFNEPWGIAVDSSENVYVADTKNNRIEKFDKNGVYLSKWGTFGIFEGQFNNPRGLALDSSGNIYVADAYNNRIQKFNTSGTFVTAWGKSGTGNSQFGNPSGVAVSSDGHIYVADKSNHRIQKFHEEADPPVIPPVVAGPGLLKIVGGQNGYVNTSNGETCLIQFTSGLAGAVNLYVLSSEGTFLKTIASISDGVSVSTYNYDCKDEDGKYLSSGIYTIKIIGPAISMTKKLAIAR